MNLEKNYVCFNNNVLNIIIIFNQKFVYANKSKDEVCILIWQMFMALNYRLNPKGFAAYANFET